MALSIFNSKSWLLSWIVFVLVTAFSLFFYERELRDQGFLPSVDLHEDLWSWHRMNAGGSGDDKLVLLGASRLLLDTSMAELKERYPGSSIHMLGLNGKYPLSTLESLANDEDFTGTVVVSLNAQALEPFYWDMQQDYVDHYEHQFSFYLSLDAWLKSIYQSRLVFADSSLAWPKLVNYYDKNERFLDPGYTTRALDLSIRGDFELIDAERLSKHFYNEKLKDYQDNPPTKLVEWLPQIEKVNEMTRKIIDRGGNVVLLRLPTSNGHWELDDEYYPKETYWDRLAERSYAPAVHFLDIKGLSDFDLPDTSHLDFRDRDRFTSTLFDGLPVELK
jgi:hypothetical protein